MRLLTKSQPAEAVPVDPPPGFGPLPLHVRREIIEKVGLARPGLAHDKGPVPMRFLASGSPAAGDGSRESPAGKTLTLMVAPLPWRPDRAWNPPPRDPESRELWGAPPDPSTMVPVDLAGQLDRWFCDPEGRCWQAGDPWPSGPAPVGEWRPLGRDVVRAIRRSHHTPSASMSSAIMGGTFVLYDPATGRCRGTALDVELDPAMFVRVWVFTHLDDLDLEGVRVDPVTGAVSDVPARLYDDGEDGAA